MKYLILILLLALAGCVKERGYVVVECFDHMDKILYRERLHSFTAEAPPVGEKSNIHICIITGEGEE